MVNRSNDLASKRFVALARVSSREQEREGFSLDIQEEALQRYATQHNGTIVKLFRIAETASKKEERSTFKELLAFARQHSHKLDGVLFCKVDRAARNLHDYVKIEQLEEEHGVPAIYVNQPTDNSPAGKMMRRMLANMASFYTDQQSLDVQAGIKRRVESGLFAGKAPYGYRNVRVEGRSLVQVDERRARVVRRMFELYGYRNFTVDELIDRMEADGEIWTEAKPRFTKSKVHTMLGDRAYIGEVHYKGDWLPGQHEPIIDKALFQRVQRIYRGGQAKSHELAFAANLIECGHCGHAITGERIKRKSRSGVKHHVYYRCSRYQSDGHPRYRVKEADLDGQFLELFQRIRIEDEKQRDWFRHALLMRTREERKDGEAQIAELNRQLTLARNQEDELLNLRLLGEFDAETCRRKGRELRERMDELKIKIESIDRGRAEHADVAMKAFELSQTLTDQWHSADSRVKRKIVELVSLNHRLVGLTLCYDIRKPFDALVEGLPESNGRGDRI